MKEANEKQEGFYKEAWIFYFPTLNTYNGCLTCNDQIKDGGKYSILKNLGKGQTWQDFCSIACAKQHVDKENK